MRERRKVRISNTVKLPSGEVLATLNESGNKRQVEREQEVGAVKIYVTRYLQRSLSVPVYSCNFSVCVLRVNLVETAG